MFFNLYRSTKAAQKEYENKKLSNIGKSIITSQERIFNNLKRQKLKEFLSVKFMKKYKLRNPDQTIDNEITNFVRGDKLSDIDLQNLDNKIEKIITTRKNPKSTLNKNLSGNNILTNKSQENLPPIEQNKNELALNQIEDNQIKKLRPSASVDILPRYKITYKNPEEELAKLEAELGDFEPKKKSIKRLDFSGLGNEWYAIAAYNKKLYDKQILEEKKKEAEIRRKMKEDLDNQIKNKLKKQYEEKLKEEEENKKYQEHIKNMEIVEKEKKERMKQQIVKEMAGRESQIKYDLMKRRIDQLKQKKFELNLIKTIKEEMENEKKVAAEKRIKENEALKKVLKDNEIYREKKKELLKKAKEDDVETCKEMERNEMKRDLERKRYFDNIKRAANKYDPKKNEDILNKINNEKKEEDDKLLKFILEEKKKEEEDEKKAKLKKIENKIKLQQFLEKQIEEKKKGLDLLKSLDDEQDKIWNIDSQKFKEEQAKNKIIMKNKNKNNLDALKEQMKSKEKNKNKEKEIMSTEEYYLNREILEKAKEELEQNGK